MAEHSVLAATPPAAIRASTSQDPPPSYRMGPEIPPYDADYRNSFNEDHGGDASCDTRALIDLANSGKAEQTETGQGRESSCGMCNWGSCNLGGGADVCSCCLECCNAVAQCLIFCISLPLACLT